DALPILANIALLNWSTRRHDRRCRLGCIDELPHPLRRERKIKWLDTEGRQRSRNRIRNHTADRNDPALAGAFGTQWVVRRWLVLERNGANVRKIACGGHQIVGERTGQQLTLLVIDEVNEKRAPETL